MNNRTRREGIEQILSYEIKSIAKHRYCLWTFGSTQIHKDTILKICIDRKKQNKDAYVLFDYTSSSKYSNKEKEKFCSLVIKENKFLTESDYLFLNLEKDKRGNFIVNEDMDCTATKAKSALAFVIEEFYFLEENIDFNNLKTNYLRVNKDFELSSKENTRKSTSYLKLKENLSEDKLEYKFKDNTTRSFQFIAKLTSPFVVRLDKNIKKMILLQLSKILNIKDNLIRNFCKKYYNLF
ncbi:hypothetical protein [Parvimonas micra]